MRGVKGHLETHASLLEPRYPPRPMLMDPAINSARPPNMTTLVSPSADRPAVNAKGTVNPSDRPIVASDMNLGSKRHGLSETTVEVVEVVESAMVLYGNCEDCMNVPFSGSVQR